MVRKNIGQDRVRSKTQPCVLFQQIQTGSFPDKPNVVTCHFTPLPIAPHTKISFISKYPSPELVEAFYPHQFLFLVKERGRKQPLLLVGKTEMQKDTAYLRSLLRLLTGPLTARPRIETSRLVCLPSHEGKLCSTVPFAILITRNLHDTVGIAEWLGTQGIEVQVSAQPLTSCILLVVKLLYFFILHQYFCQLL